MCVIFFPDIETGLGPGATRKLTAELAEQERRGWTKNPDGGSS